MKSPIKYFGGKGTMYKTIINHFPDKSDYDIYIEPFGGSFSVGLQKEPHGAEIYNDLEKNVFSLYKVLSDTTLFKVFKEKCDLIFYSDDIRKTFKEYLKNDDLDIVDRAFYFFYVNRSSHNGIGGFSMNTVIRRTMSKSVSDFLSSIDRLPELHDRLSKVMVSNTDGIELIKRYDNPRTFFYCIPENELVIINNKPIKIQDVNVGEMCSNDNRILKKHIRYTNNEELIRINVMGLGKKFPITLSKDHVIFKYENDNVVECKGENLKVGDMVIIKPYNNDLNTKTPDIVYENKKSHTKQLKFNNDLNQLTELLGFYAAEGHSQNGLFFSFNSNEKNYLERVKSLIDSVFNIESYIYENSPHPTVSQVRVFSVEIENFFKKLIDGTSLTKKFSDYVMNLEPKYQLNILKSWLKGDGGIWYDNSKIKNKTNKVRSGKRNKYKITGTSSSWIMINQLYQMALRCHLHPSIKKRENSYDLYFTTKHDIEMLTNIKTNGRSCKRRKWIDDFMITPITNIETIKYTGNMYDLTTENGYFYLSFGVKSHNCDPPYEQSTRTNTRYSVDMDRSGHEKFLETVINTKSKILISGYDCELYDILIENGFVKINFDVNTMSGNYTRKIKTETLWKNY